MSWKQYTTTGVTTEVGITGPGRPGHAVEDQSSDSPCIVSTSETSSQSDDSTSSSGRSSILFSSSNTARNQVLAVLSISYLCISCGNFLGYTSSAIVSMKEDLDSKFTATINKHDESWIGSLGPLGAVCGGLFATLLIKYFGVRKTVLYFGSTLFIASWTMIGVAQSLWPIFVGRFVGGVATAIVISCAPLYVVEISSVAQRGRLGVIPQGLMLLGILISFTFGNFLNWRWVARACGVLATPSIILGILTPDSPSMLFANSKTWHIGRQVLRLFHDFTEAELEYERLAMHKTKKAREIEKDSNRQWKVANLKACGVAVAVMSFQQLTGINGVTFYAVTIFKKTGADSLCSPHLFPVLLVISQCIGSFTSSMIIERVGRKTLLSISTGCICLMAAVLGFYFYLDGVSNQALFWIPLLALLIYVGTFALGLGSTAWIYVSETLPEHNRQLVNPLIIGYTWFCVFLITKSFPLLLSEIHIHGIFWMYSFVAATGCLFVFLCVPETKGRSIHEIQYYFKYGHYESSKEQGESGSV